MVILLSVARNVHEYIQYVNYFLHHKYQMLGMCCIAKNIYCLQSSKKISHKFYCIYMHNLI